MSTLYWYVISSMCNTHQFTRGVLEMISLAPQQSQEECSANSGLLLLQVERLRLGEIFTQDHWATFNVWFLDARKERVIVTCLSSPISILQTSSWAVSAGHKAGWSCRWNHSGFYPRHLRHSLVQSLRGLTQKDTLCVNSVLGSFKVVKKKKKKDKVQMSS